MVKRLKSEDKFLRDIKKIIKDTLSEFSIYLSPEEQEYFIDAIIIDIETGLENKEYIVDFLTKMTERNYPESTATILAERIYHMVNQYIQTPEGRRAKALYYHGDFSTYFLPFCIAIAIAVYFINKTNNLLPGSKHFYSSWCIVTFGVILLICSIVGLFKVIFFRMKNKDRLG